MKKAATLTRLEKGQTLLIVAVVMVGLIALTGLAIDGGNLFVQRREAQNAADAAALAGARVLAKAIHTCGGSASALDQQIAQEINGYAEVNGISDTDGNLGNGVNDNVAGHYVTGDGTVLGTVGGGAVPEGTIGVQVHVQDQHETFFITIVGIGSATSSAQATAVVGAVTALPPGAGVLPFGVHVDVLNGIGYDTSFESIDISDSGSNGQFCTDPDGDGDYDDCVTVSDPSGAQRGWFNLNFIYNLQALPSNATNPLNRTFEPNVSNSGCGKDPSISLDDGLVGWATLPDAEGNCAYPFSMYAGAVGGVDGDYIHGGPGARASTIDAIRQTYVGHIGVIPIFDKVYSVDYMSAHFAPAQPPPGTSGGAWPTAGGGTDAWMYHVVGFVGMLVEDMDKGADVLTGSFRESIFGTGRVSTDIHGYDPDGCDNRMFAVVLWE